MNKLEYGQNKQIVPFSEFNLGLFDGNSIVVCDSHEIRCKNLAELKELQKVVVVVPENDLTEGSSGYAKAQILASFPGVVAVVGAPELALRRVTNGEFGGASVLGMVTFKESFVVASGPGQKEEVSIPVTNLNRDIQFMNQTKELLPQSNCWWMPTACILVKDSKVIMTATSKNQWGSNCQDLDIKPHDTVLRKGERIDFCDAIHAERRAIAGAAGAGISVLGSELFITSFPCEECAKVLVESGVKSVIFEKGSYGLKDASLLTRNGVKLARVQC